MTMPFAQTRSADTSYHVQNQRSEDQRNQVINPMEPAYKILIADDHPLFREAISSVIASGFENTEIIETENLDNALEIAKNTDDLDLILLDLNMPGMHGLNGLITLRNEAPSLPVVIVSAEQDKQVVLQAITYGAIGFITKSSPRAEMTEAIQQILNGNVYLPSDIIRTSKESHSRRHRNDENPISPEMLNSLTRRQLLVLERMAKGESNKQIAYNLNIAETTVKAHVSAILRKLAVHNRVQAILSAGDVDFSHYLKR
ncbi:MAG: Response regulator containing a CheY-like receiver domain and an HTH DNA-binding domain [Marinobacter excellens HL-55]|uniref:Response regulator containing a CheY-like receiver domain and an HTH DNA-binding domain n=1 Tax=Marinobacter excellens HL-55 TaxID=1305731 RepID=A0A0P8D242_9GAMM|nr:MAG: Response regulator containing a CheY-like receiver domain and an HTH DNA-binding domain [Marinobacter excellens HL-55]